MINRKILTAFEFDKIAAKLTEYCSLRDSRESILSDDIDPDFGMVKYRQSLTREAYLLLYTYGVGGVESFDKMDDEIMIAQKGGTLTCRDLLRCARLLKSARITFDSINRIEDPNVILLKNIVANLYYNKYLENEIFTKVISEDDLADDASEKLYELRKKIIDINERIREKLLSYMRNKADKYMQDNIVSIRNGRYVIPVKAEFKNNVRGLIHDQSASGNTVYIEPTEVLDLNNQLRETIIAEKAEVERILGELSSKIGLIGEKLNYNIQILVDVDKCYAKATYSYKNKCREPIINERGFIDIKKGRHPLIDKAKVVPVSVSLGEGYRYIIITGPNTGGKTVTLKLIGLLSLMAYYGLFIPADDESKISVFDDIFCDIGDEQSIEQNLSTFSSHMKNIIDITENANSKSLVLIDEIGAGTDPEEGSCLACAILNHLVQVGSFGVITTHYSLLKEYALSNDGIINASMDFNTTTFEPLYKLKIGIPGTSNAIEISKRLGLSEEIIASSREYLSQDKITFDNILNEAEHVRAEAEEIKSKYLEELVEIDEKLDYINKEKAKIEAEKEKLLYNAKVKARQIINDKTDEAEEMLNEMKEIFHKEEYTDGDLVKMATLKNKIEDKKYHFDDEEEAKIIKEVKIEELKIGDNVTIPSMELSGKITKINFEKKTVSINAGSFNMNIGVDKIQLDGKIVVDEEVKVSIKRESVHRLNTTELYILGKSVDEGIQLVDQFIDSAILSHFEVVRIVHGKGRRILGKGIQEYLRGDRRVESFRYGKYGEGEDGVTIVTLKKE